jgi:hypothetical protein
VVNAEVDDLDVGIQHDRLVGAARRSTELCGERPGALGVAAADGRKRTVLRQVHGGRENPGDLAGSEDSPAHPLVHLCSLLLFR